MTLIEWLREQIDADERVALAAQPGAWYRSFSQVMAETGQVASSPGLVLTNGEHWDDNYVCDAATKGDASHIANWDPVRVLAEVKAKRAIIERELDYAVSIDGEWGCVCDRHWIAAGSCPEIGETGLPIIRALAQPYADLTGWQDEWKVTE